MQDRDRLRTVAVIEIVKGVVILAIGLGFLSADSQLLENAGAALLRVLDLDPTMGAPRKFLVLLHTVGSEHDLLAFVAAAYAALRFVEGFGLWHGRGWARWLGLVSAGVYVPFEVYYFLKGPGPVTFFVMLVNLAIMWLLWPRQPPAISLPTQRDTHEHQV